MDREVIEPIYKVRARKNTEIVEFTVYYPILYPLLEFLKLKTFVSPSKNAIAGKFESFEVIPFALLKQHDLVSCNIPPVPYPLERMLNIRCVKLRVECRE